MTIQENLLFTDNPIPMLVCSEGDKKILDVNKSFIERYGNGTAIVGSRLDDITQPIPSDIAPANSSLSPERDFLTLMLPNGKSIMVELTYNKIPEDDKPYYLGTIEELFPSLHNENAVQHPIFKSIFDKALDIILVANDQGQFQQVNNTACQKLGYEKEELLEMGVQDITYEPMKSYTNKKWEDFLRTGTDKGEYLLETKDGEVLPTEYRAVANIQPGQHLSILRDVSDYHQVKKELEVSEDRFSRLLEAIPDALFIVSEDGTIDFCNSQAEEMLGYREDELLGESIDILVPKTKRGDHKGYRQSFTENPYKRPMGSDLKLNALRKDGSKVPVDIMLGPLKENGSLQTLAVVRDISDLRKTRNKLEREKEFTKLLHDLTKIANESKSVDEALSRSIKQICSFMNWPVGHAYLPAQDGSGEFYPTDHWHLSDPQKFANFKNFTMGTRFSAGMGMVGSVIETGEPQWRDNVHKDPNFVRRLPDEDLGIRACFAFPILVDNNVVGILEFFASHILEEDPLLLEKMATIGYQLGRVYERDSAQKKLKKREQKFRKLFNTASDAILILGTEKVHDCNQSAEDLFRCSCHQLQKSTLTDFFPEKETNIAISEEMGRQKLKNAFNGNDQFFEWKFRRADGSIFDAEVSLIYMEMDGQDYIQAVIRDITERKQKDQLIRKNMELFSQLFANSPVGIVILDDDHRIKNINSHFEKIFGYSLPEIKNKKGDELLAPDNLKNEAYNITEKTMDGAPMQVESVRIHKNGQKIPVLIASVPVEIENEIIAVFGIYIDLSERRKVEEKLEKQLKEKKVLLAEIHHRVKNNLAVISGLLELQKESTEHEEAYQKMQDSQARIQSMSLIHEQLYQMEFYASLEFDKYVKSLANTIASSNREDDTEIDLIYDTEPVELNIDQAITCGLFLNELLTNAYKHAFIGRDAGIVSISIHKQDEQQVIIEVKDNGIGLPEDFKMDQKNSLGFSLIKTLTQQLSGDLEVSEDEGSCFTLSFEKESLE